MTPSTVRDLLEEIPDDSAIAEEKDDLIDSVGDSSFHHWRRRQPFEDNIRDGKSHLNGPSSPLPPLEHNSSQFNRCHRKIYYRQHNGPKETADPAGIFSFGNELETGLIVPYLRDITSQNVYVQNSVWTDFMIKSDSGLLRIKGETDPVFIDTEGVPFLLTEIKTKDSADRLSSPNDHHFAQAHAYMYGLTQEFDRRVTDVLLVYSGRTNLNLKIFHREFDPVLWLDDALDWAGSLSQFRIEERLPPAEPKFDWECRFRSYRKRCGKQTDEIGNDSPPHDFTPIHDYSTEAVVTYLAAHEEKELQLKQAVANEFSELVSEVGVYDWRCYSSDGIFNWQYLQPPADEPVSCPACERVTNNEWSVCGPTPEEQVLINDE